MRFIHTADWQLGMTRHFLDADAQARFTAARFDVIRSVLGLAQSEQAEFVVVAGDVFESNQLDRRTVARALEALGEIDVPVFLLPGNHDPLDASSVYRSEEFARRAPRTVAVLDGREPVTPTPGVELIAAPWRSKRPSEDLAAAACASLELGEGTLRVLVAHGAVDAMSPDRDNPALLRLGDLEQAIGDGSIHYAALGDRHSATEVGATGRVWYSGAPEPTDYDELRPGFALVVDLEPGTCEVSQRQVGTWRFARERFELPGAAGVDGVRRWLDGQPGKDRTVARLLLSGAISVRESAELSALLEAQRQVYAAIEAPMDDLAVLPGDGEFGDLGLSGFALASLERLTAQARADAEGSDAAAGALALLYRLAGGAA
ncbi:MAG TPA: exonuclease SbcCD subunit D [Egibacteraceae bacterium]|nr:exonuclease SbcCD subunit D [Egibacteraceae bacterium]